MKIGTDLRNTEAFHAGKARLASAAASDEELAKLIATNPDKMLVRISSSGESATVIAQLMEIYDEISPLRSFEPRILQDQLVQIQRREDAIAKRIATRNAQVIARTAALGSPVAVVASETSLLVENNLLSDYLRQTWAKENALYQTHGTEPEFEKLWNEQRLSAREAGSILRKLREKSGLSVGALSKKSGVPKSRIYKFELGDIPCPEADSAVRRRSFRRLKAVIEALGIQFPTL